MSAFKSPSHEKSIFLKIRSFFSFKFFQGHNWLTNYPDSEFHGHWKTVTLSSISSNLSKHWRFLAFWLSLCFGSFLLFLVCHDTAFLLSTRAMTTLGWLPKLVSVYWQVENYFHAEFVTKVVKITWQNHKVTFSIIQLIWQILKQLSHSGSVNSARYMPWRFASPCIYPPLFTSPRPSRDICILLPLHAETLLRIYNVNFWQDAGICLKYHKKSGV